MMRFPAIPAKAAIQCLWACLVLSSSALAAAPAADPLQQFVQKVETFSARFEQEQKDDQGRVLQHSSGRLWLARPGKFRWSYEKPYQQEIVCDGQTLWQHDPDLDQVMVRPAGATLQGTPAQLLTDRAALEKHFKVESLGNDGGVAHLRLLPRAKDSDFKSVELWLKDGAPQRMRFDDPLGGANEVRFSDIRTNAPIEPKHFSFTIPKGAEVIQADGPAGR
jgi:outer membrane lipoprotein carrier protein